LDLLDFLSGRVPGKPFAAANSNSREWHSATCADGATIPIDGWDSF
jgi:hypothetical protein